MVIDQWHPRMATSFLSAPAAPDNKYSRGVLSCHTGSRKFPGAALLTTDAALATGVGMVRYSGPRSVKKLVILRNPEVVIAAGRTDAYLLGSGVSMSPLLQLHRIQHTGHVNVH